MASLEIFTYGYGDLMATALNAIAATVKGSDFKAMLATAIAIYLAKHFWSLAHGRDVHLTHSLKAITLIIALAFSLVKVTETVTVYDIPRNTSQVVDNVPVAVALPLWFSNRAEYVITKLWNTAFSLPDGVAYNSVGYLGGVKNLRDAAYYIQISNPYLRQSLVQYYKDCVFAAITDGAISPDQVKKDTVVNVIQAAANKEPSRTTVYYSSGQPKGENLTCQDASSRLKNDINNDKDNAFSTLAKASFGGSSEAALERLLGNELRYYLGISQNAKDAVYQEALLTVSHDALLQKAAEAGVDPNEIGLTVATAKEKLFLTNASMGDTIREFLPYIRAFLEITFVAVAPLLIVLGITLGRPIEYVVTALNLAAFPMFWGALSSLFNWMVSYEVSKLTNVIESTKYSTEAINISNYPMVVQALKEWLTIGGWASSMIIILSLALLSGSVYAFVRFASGFTSGFSGAAASSAGSIATGNISMGNVSLGNASYDNLSANKFDNTIGYTTGTQVSQVDGVSNLVNRENVKKAINETDIISGASINDNGVPVNVSFSRTSGVNQSSARGETGSMQITSGQRKSITNQTGNNEQFTLNKKGNFSISGRETILNADNYSLRYNANNSSTATKGKGYSNSANLGGNASYGQNAEVGKKHINRGSDIAEGNIGVRGGGGGGGNGVGVGGGVGGKGKGLISAVGSKFQGNARVLTQGMSTQDNSYDYKNSANLNTNGSLNERTDQGFKFNKTYEVSKQNDHSRTAGRNVSGSQNYQYDSSGSINQTTSKSVTAKHGKNFSKDYAYAQRISKNQSSNVGFNVKVNGSLIPAPKNPFLSNLKHYLKHNENDNLKELLALENAGRPGVNPETINDQATKKLQLLKNQAFSNKNLNPNLTDPNIKNQVKKLINKDKNNAIRYLKQNQKGLQELQDNNNRNNNAVKEKIGNINKQVDDAWDGTQGRLNRLFNRARLQISDVKDNAGKPPSLGEAFENTNKWTLGAGAVTPFAKDLALWKINSGAAKGLGAGAGEGAGAAGDLGAAAEGAGAAGLGAAAEGAGAAGLGAAAEIVVPVAFAAGAAILAAKELSPTDISMSIDPYGNYMINGKVVSDFSSRKTKEMTGKGLSELFHKGVQLKDGQSAIVKVNNPKKLSN